LARILLGDRETKEDITSVRLRNPERAHLYLGVMDLAARGRRLMLQSGRDRREGP